MPLHPTHKKRLHTNILQFVVGTILLTIAFAYLLDHQAEQTNLKSSFEGISKKINLVREKYTSGKDALMETQFKLKQQIEELYKSFQQAQCDQKIDLTQLKKDTADIATDTLDEFEQKHDAYVLTTRQYYTLLNQYCK
jgi:hypothetical protein